MSPRILFVHNHLTRFVQIDLALLRERYAVIEWYQRGRFVHVPGLARAVRRSDLIFGWFASWHTFAPLILAKMLGRPAILVVGGYDTANMPEIGYGHQRGGFKRCIARRTMHLASQLMTNSHYARDELVRNAGVDGSRVHVIYHGLADQRLALECQKRDLVLTVANVDRINQSRKGLQAFVQAAALLPAIEFAVIGAWRDDAINLLRAIAPANVTFTGWLGDQEIHEYYARAKVYVQASRHEAFGLAVAEAMQHGCVPVVTGVGALPEVVGDAGIYVNEPEADAIALGIQQAIADESMRKRAQDRVLREFPLERRRQQLCGLLEDTQKVALDQHALFASRP